MSEEMSWFQQHLAVIVTAIAGFLGVIATGFFSTKAARENMTASVQAALNASALQLTQMQERHLQDCEKRCDALEATVRGLRAHIGALERALRNQGLDIPRAPLTETVFVLDSGETPIAPGFPKELSNGL